MRTTLPATLAVFIISGCGPQDEPNALDQETSVETSEGALNTTVAPGTSVCRLTNVYYSVLGASGRYNFTAFQNTAGHLVSTYNGKVFESKLLLAPRTSPACSRGGQTAIWPGFAHHGANHHLWFAGVDTGAAMAVGTSPVMTFTFFHDGNGQRFVTAAQSGGRLYAYDSLLKRVTFLGRNVYPGSSPTKVEPLPNGRGGYRVSYRAPNGVATFVDMAL
jgi:hypothetical protein